MTASEVPTRQRILDAALDLAARKGFDGTSMRELADACDLNVAALYYHFPSKADLLKAVIAERRYDLMMGLVTVAPRGSAPDRRRLEDLLAAIWTGIRDEEPVWRLLLAESCHHTPDAEHAASALVAEFEAAATRWLADEFDDLAVPVAVAARLVADHLFANIARTAIGATDDDEVTAHATALAAVLVGPG